MEEGGQQHIHLQISQSINTEIREVELTQL